MPSSHSQSPVLKPSPSLSEGLKASAASAPGRRSPSPGPSAETKAKAEPEERKSELQDLRGQMKELLLSVELLKTQQM